MISTLRGRNTRSDIFRPLSRPGGSSITLTPLPPASFLAVQSHEVAPGRTASVQDGHDAMMHILRGRPEFAFLWPRSRPGAARPTISRPRPLFLLSAARGCRLPGGESLARRLLLINENRRRRGARPPVNIGSVPTNTTVRKWWYKMLR
jgi:hypothetical protein